MKVGISIKLDVTKIDKARLFKGEKGTYLDLTTFVDLDRQDQYENNGFISQSQTKEEREARAPHTPILGNVKVFYKDGGQASGSAPVQPAQSQAAPQSNDIEDAFEDDIPFSGEGA